MWYLTSTKINYLFYKYIHIHPTPYSLQCLRQFNHFDAGIDFRRQIMMCKIDPLFKRIRYLLRL